MSLLPLPARLRSFLFSGRGLPLFSPAGRLIFSATPSLLLPPFFFLVRLSHPRAPRFFPFSGVTAFFAGRFPLLSPFAQPRRQFSLSTATMATSPSSLPPLTGKPLSRDEFAQYVFSTCPITIDAAVQEALSRKYARRFGTREFSPLYRSAGIASLEGGAPPSSSSLLLNLPASPSFSSLLNSSFLPPLPLGTVLLPSAAVRAAAILRVTSLLHPAAGVRPPLLAALLELLTGSSTVEIGSRRSRKFGRGKKDAALGAFHLRACIPPHLEVASREYPSNLVYMLAAAAERMRLDFHQQEQQQHKSFFSFKKANTRTVAANSVLLPATAAAASPAVTAPPTASAAAAAPSAVTAFPAAHLNADFVAKVDGSAAGAKVSFVRTPTSATPPAAVTVDEAVAFCRGSSEAAGRLFVVSRQLEVLLDLLDCNTALMTELFLLPHDFFSQQQKQLPQLKGIQASATNITVLLHDSKLQHLPRKTPEEVARLFPTLAFLLPALGNLREAVTASSAYIDAELKLAAARPPSLATGAAAAPRAAEAAGAGGHLTEAAAARGPTAAAAKAETNCCWQEVLLSSVFAKEEDIFFSPLTAIFNPSACSLKAALDALLFCLLSPSDACALEPLLQEAAAAANSFSPVEQIAFAAAAAAEAETEADRNEETSGGDCKHSLRKRRSHHASETAAAALLSPKGTHTEDSNAAAAAAVPTTNVFLPPCPPSSLPRLPASPAAAHSSASSTRAHVFLASEAVAWRAEFARYLQQRFQLLLQQQQHTSLFSWRSETPAAARVPAAFSTAAGTQAAGGRKAAAAAALVGAGKRTPWATDGWEGERRTEENSSLLPLLPRETSALQIVVEVEERLRLLQQTVALQTALLLQLVEAADMRTYAEVVAKASRSKKKKKPLKGRYLMSAGTRRYSTYIFEEVQLFLQRTLQPSSSSSPPPAPPLSATLQGLPSAAIAAPAAAAAATATQDTQACCSNSSSLSSSPSSPSLASSSSSSLSSSSLLSSYSSLSSFSSASSSSFSSPAAACGIDLCVGVLQVLLGVGERHLLRAAADVFADREQQQQQQSQQRHQSQQQQWPHGRAPPERREATAAAAAGEAAVEAQEETREGKGQEVVEQQHLKKVEEEEEEFLGERVMTGTQCKAPLSPWFSPQEAENMCWLERQRDRLSELLRACNQQRRIPKVAKGTQDFTPQQMVVRRVVLEAIREVFLQHGGVEIDTPVFELRETLMGKYGENQKLVYDLQDQGGEQLSLRYDLTVPFARYVASHDVEKIRRFHIGKVYRRDEPQMQKGRCREFIQCDFDIAGPVAVAAASPLPAAADAADAAAPPASPSSPGQLLPQRAAAPAAAAGGSCSTSSSGGLYPSMAADAEAVTILVHILRKLQQRAGPFCVKVNHRRLLDGVLLDVCGLAPEKFAATCSAIDKLDKEPWKAVREEMVEQKGVPPHVADAIGSFILPRKGPLHLLVEELERSFLRSSSAASDSFSSASSSAFLLSPAAGAAGSANGAATSAFSAASAAAAATEMETASARGKKSEKLAAALADMRRLSEFLEAMGVQPHETQFDLSLARGLDYYTGLIFEAVLLPFSSSASAAAAASVAFGAAGGGAGEREKHADGAAATAPAEKEEDEEALMSEVGSVGAGGRYDNLVGMFSGRNVPAVGLSVGVERLFRVVEARFGINACSSSSSSGTKKHAAADAAATASTTEGAGAEARGGGGGARGDKEEKQGGKRSGKKTAAAGGVDAAAAAATSGSSSKSDPAGGVLQESCTDVLVCAVGDNLLKTCMRVARLLWDAGIAAEFYAAERGVKLKKQMDYASQRRIPLLVIIGEKEVQRSVVKLRPLFYRDDDDQQQQQQEQEQQQKREQGEGGAQQEQGGEAAQRKQQPQAPQQRQQQHAVGREEEEEIGWNDLPAAVHAYLKRRGTSLQRTRRQLLPC